MQTRSVYLSVVLALACTVVLACSSEVPPPYPSVGPAQAPGAPGLAPISPTKATAQLFVSPAGDAGRALRVGESLDDTGLSPERRARLRIDVARAHTQRRNVDDAVAVLEEADVIAPEQVRSHPLVRSLVSDLLQMTPSASEGLSDLATKIGLDQ